MKILTSNYSDPLQQVLAVYGNRIVVHQFNSSSNSLGAGTPLTVDSAKGIFCFIQDSEFEEKYSFKGLIPPNVLYFNAETPHVVWTSEPGVRQLYFQEDLPMNTGYYPTPKLLWKLTHFGLYVYALKEEKPCENTPLFQAPFLNTSSDGSVCMGTSDYKTKGRYYERHIQKAENAFFSSVFTHTNTDTLLTINIVDALNEMAEKKTKVFDNSLLVEVGKTIKDIL